MFGTDMYSDEIGKSYPVADITNIQRSSMETFFAGVRQAQVYSTSTSLYNWARLETNNFEPQNFLLPHLQSAIPEDSHFGGAQIPVQQAKDLYGLNINTERETISQELAVELYHEKIRNDLDQMAMSARNYGIDEAFGAGLIASALDPIELAASIYLPITKLARTANVGAKFIPRSARVLAAKTLKTPFLSGAIEGGVGNALFTPILMSTAHAQGLEYGPTDAFIEIFAGGVLGATIQGLGHVVGPKLRPKPVSASQVVDDALASAAAHSDIAQGRGSTAYNHVAKDKLLDDMAAARQEAEQLILGDEPSAARVSDPVEAAGDALEEALTGNSQGQVTSKNGAIPQDGSAKLPHHLRFIGGRYGAATLNFNNDIERALWTIGQGKKNKRHDEIMQWLKEATGLSEEELVNLRSELKQNILRDVDRTDVSPQNYEGLNLDEKLSSNAVEPSATPSGADTPVRTPEPQPTTSRPIELQSEQARKHMSTLEQSLASIVDPESAQIRLQEHIQDILLLQARLADLTQLSGREFLENVATARQVQTDLLNRIEELYELFPDVGQVVDTTTLRQRTNQNGLLRKKAFDKLGKSIRELNEQSLGERTPAEKIAFLQERLETAHADLKKAQSKLSELTTKGQSTTNAQEAMQIAIAEIAHTNNLVRSLGGDVGPNVQTATLREMVFAMGEEASPALKELAETVEGDELFRRVRRNIKGNVISRLKSTEDWLRKLDQSTPEPHAERKPVVRQLQEYIASAGQEKLDPDRALETALAGIDEELAEAKSLGILTDDMVKFLDGEAEKTKAALEKIDAFDKGAIQAQICALGGIDE